MIKRRSKEDGRERPPVYTEQLKLSNAKSSGKHLNESLGNLEESRFKRKYFKLINELFKELHFTYEEIESLVIMYYHLVKTDGSNPNRTEVTKAEIKTMLHDTFDITDPFLLEIILPIIDQVAGPNFSINNWLRTMSLFLRGTLEEKIQFCFRVYDYSRQGKLQPKMLAELMNGCIVGDSGDVSKDIVDMLLKKMDVGRSGSISLEDFREAVINQPLLLECFGQCLPTRAAVHSVLATFTPYTGKL